MALMRAQFNAAVASVGPVRTADERIGARRIGRIPLILLQLQNNLARDRASPMVIWVRCAAMFCFAMLF
ncbi:MAG: hypothetical protein QNJ16_06065 [Rhodobacter sp.]|nr:hypothetical protein [Rhodobacter sp.]